MRISQILVYPVKSLRGCSVATAKLTPQGLQYDRKYMLVQVDVEADGSVEYKSLFIGNVDALCLFTTSLLPSDDAPETIRVLYTSPDSRETSFIDIPVAADYKNLDKVNINLHQSRCQGYDMGQEYENFFTSHLGYRTKLVYIGDSTREVLGNVAPNKTHITKDSPNASSEWFIYRFVSAVAGYVFGTTDEYRLHFSDCAPLLVTSQASLLELNRNKPKDQEVTLDITKTRPNIVLEPSTEGEMAAFEEDYWGELAIANSGDPIRILLTANCGRCKSLNVDYATGKQLPVKEHMLKRLADMKRRVDPGMGYSPVFGRYGFVEKASLGREIELGDRVEVSRRNQERTVFFWPGLSPGTRPK